MAVSPADLDKVREAARREAWQEVHDILSAFDRDALAAEDIETLSDSAWWLCLADEYLDTRRLAYTRFLGEDKLEKAVFCTWHLFYEHLSGVRFRWHLDGSKEPSAISSIIASARCTDT